MVRSSAGWAQGLWGKRLRTCWNSSIARRGWPWSASAWPISNWAAAAASEAGYSSDTRRLRSAASA